MTEVAVNVFYSLLKSLKLDTLRMMMLRGVWQGKCPRWGLSSGFSVQTPNFCLAAQYFFPSSAGFPVQTKDKSNTLAVTNFQFHTNDAVNNLCDHGGLTPPPPPSSSVRFTSPVSTFHSDTPTGDDAALHVCHLHYGSVSPNHFWLFTFAFSFLEFLTSKSSGFVRSGVSQSNFMVSDLF